MREKKKNLANLTKLFSSSETAAHLEHISNLENLTRNKGGGGEREKGGVVKERGPVVTQSCAIPLHHCV